MFGWGCFRDKEGKKFFSPSPAASDPCKDIKKQQDVPLRIVGVEHAVDISCGSTFCLVRCSDGAVYSWGLGEQGELGRGTDRARNALALPPLRVHGEYDLPAIYQYVDTRSLTLILTLILLFVV